MHASMHTRRVADSWWEVLCLSIAFPSFQGSGSHTLSEIKFSTELMKYTDCALTAFYERAEDTWIKEEPRLGVRLGSRTHSDDRESNWGGSEAQWGTVGSLESDLNFEFASATHRPGELTCGGFHFLHLLYEGVIITDSQGCVRVR